MKYNKNKRKGFIQLKKNSFAVVFNIFKMHLGFEKEEYFLCLQRLFFLLKSKEYYACF